MISIFYDLETSDREPIGQILNYAFVAVDGDWAVVDELSGQIMLSRLQLPAPDAILANRVNVLEHQRRARDCERSALGRIWDFIAGIRSSAGSVALIGYNSTRFDLPYLRTSMIRNGFNPYFGGGLSYRDLLFAARKLACTHTEFPRTAKAAEGADGRLALTLENLSQRLGLLTGRQLHSSREDVLLTIDLARLFAKRFGLDVRSFSAYEPVLARKGDLCSMLVPNYDLSGTPAIVVPYVLLDSDYRSALWINLERFEGGEGRSSVSWFNKNTGCFTVGDSVPSGAAAVARRALEECRGLTSANYFTASTCDIEQDIYRLDFDAIGALESAIAHGDLRPLKACRGREARVVYLRHQLASYEWGTGQDPRMWEILRRYALYRYGGGELKLNKFGGQEVSDRYHASFVELADDLEKLARAGSAADRRLLAALREFYRTSDLVKAAGFELDATNAAAAAG